MTLRRDPRVPPRRSALAAALALAGCCASAAGASPSAQNLAVSMPVGASRGAGVAALMQTLHQASAQQHGGARPTGAATLTVTSCADDSSAGTLRAKVAAASSGDVIELGTLACSTITLTQGAIGVKPDSLTIHGPGAAKLAVDGGASDRVFVHYGYGSFTLGAVTVRNGRNHLSGYKVAGGACLVGNGEIVLDHAMVSGCSTIGEGAYGGAILAHDITLYTSTLSGNTAQGSDLPGTLTASYGGGAFAYKGTIAAYDSVISGNRATNYPGSRYSYDTGGGMFADFGGYILRSTMAGNYTDGTGGAVGSRAPLFVTNSTISGNTAKKAGGGLFLRFNASSAIRNSTIALNSAGVGGGIYVVDAPGTLRLDSTIVATNHASKSAADLGSTSPLTILGGNDLLIAASANVTLPADTLRSDPQLLPLAGNGGTTPTHALTASSPAIDRGNNASGLATDQRGPGFPRVLGAAPDIGAFEEGPRAAAAVLPAPAMSPSGIAWLACALAMLGCRARASERKIRTAVRSACAGQRSG